MSDTQHEPHVVYVLRDAAGEVLYVGATISLPDRMRQHRTKPWYADVATIQVDSEHSWKPPAMIREHEVICELRPKHNRKGADVIWWQEVMRRESMTYDEVMLRGSIYDAVREQRREQATA